ncbi:MAG: SDR family NAD(P)-dependent oxidoreductase [Spirochaetaceae bacterium]|nr:MAG: SDR family NAD(P)-dependent oxidoreductase [Spirochaetaceae bacterium]
MVGAYADEYGPLRLYGTDILFNNAGSTIRKPIHELSLGAWNQVITNNLTSMSLVTRESY